MPNKPNLSIIGLGKLGSSMMAAFASRGFKVIGVDVNPETCRLISEGKAPVLETNLAKYLAENGERVSATEDYEEAVLNSDITFVVVPTPSESHGGFSTKYVVSAGQKIAEALKNKSSFHLVVLTSTVTPTSTEKYLLTVLENYSGKKCGDEFGLCYNPEFIALGQVIRDLLNPDFVLIGESDKKSGDILKSFYKDALEKEAPIKRMSIINAEITKIALNTYVTTKMSYANMMAELCENIPGANIDVVTDALGQDTRIGHRYLKGAIGYGGPCFPRDNRALTSIAKEFGVALPIAEATDKINQYQVPRLIEKILKILPQGDKIGILGLSYKPNTNVIEESQGLEIAKKLSEKGIEVIVYDPISIGEAKKVLTKVEFTDSLREAVEKSDVIFIATPWEEFKKIEPSWFGSKNKKTIVFDCWRILESQKYGNKIKYLPLGVWSQ